jgi:hypothetical protein
LNRFSKIALVFFYFILVNGSEGQVIDSLKDIYLQGKFITVGVGGGHASLQDQGISPLLYSGAGGAAQIGYSSYTAKAVHHAYIRFDFNSLLSEVSGGTIYSYQTTGSYQYFNNKFDFSTAKINWSPGLFLDFNWALRDHTTYTNNSLHIDTRIAFSPAINVNREFKLWKRQFEIGGTWSIPVISYVSRPLFASTQFPATVNKEEPKWFDYIAEGSFYSLGKNRKINMQSYLVYRFKNNNGLRFDYYWSFANLNADNPIKNAGHTFLISTMLKL